MKKILVHLLAIILISVFNFSCDDQLIGKWDDNIHLSTKNVEFKATTDSVTITTGGSSWWITYICVEGDYFHDFRNIDLETDSYTIQYDSITVERRDKNTLFIKIKENPNNVQRNISIGLEAGDYFDRVYITQKAK